LGEEYDSFINKVRQKDVRIDDFEHLFKAVYIDFEKKILHKLNDEGVFEEKKLNFGEVNFH